jgi:hypothetical protein
MKNGQYIRWISPTWLVLCLCLSFAVSCQKPPIKMNLISDNISYKPEDPIQMQIRVFNDNTNIFGQKRPVIARQGFFYQNFHLLLTIIDPNGVPVAKRFAEPAIEPALAYRSGNRFLVPVEIIPPDGENVYVMNDARKYYRLGEIYGWYTADVRASLETFSRYKERPTGELYGELFARCNKAYNPLSSNKIRFEIAPAEPPFKAALKVYVNLLTATGGLQQKVSALENADARLYRVSKIPPKYMPISRKVYGIIWNNVKSQQSRLTYANGTATFSGIEQDDYLILARHPAFADVNITGKLLAKDDAQWQAGKVVELSLSVIRKPDGTVEPGNTGKILEGIKAARFIMNDLGYYW